MRVIYIDCTNGVTREGLLGALSELDEGADSVISSPVGICADTSDEVLRLLEGARIRGREGAVVTAGGAEALMKTVGAFGDMPEMKLLRSAACGGVRAYLGEIADKNGLRLLSCNIDDMTAEALGYAQEVLFNAGAHDVFTVAVGMKKSRQGVLLNCVCKEKDAAALARVMLKHTTTLGVREIACERHVLERHVREVTTEFGKIRVKFSSGEGIAKAKPEYEDAAKLAREHGVTFEEVTRAAYRALEGMQ